MKVIFITNLDNYQNHCFPEKLTMVPRKGDIINVTEVFVKYFEDKKLPTRLEVVDVIWGEKDVKCELWYKEIDVRAAKISNINLY